MKSKLPKEALLFAKTMGLNLDGLEPEAEDIWKMLDDLSKKDPIQYQEFVSQQFQNQKEPNDPSDNKRSFRPIAGFSIKASTIDGDGLKIREIQGSNKVMGKTLYVNLCSSTVIEAPIDKFGKPVLQTSVNDGLSIPLVVGAIREDGDRVLAIDVVFHSKVIELANKEKYFKKQISDLALDWVIQESGLKCNTSWEYCSSSSSDEVLYHCGRGENKDFPVLFFVSADDTTTTKPGESVSNKSSKGKDAFANTSTLLSEINKDRNSSTTNILAVDDGIKISKPSKETYHSTKSNGRNVKPNVLIQEVDGDGCSIVNGEVVDTSKAAMTTNNKETYNEDIGSKIQNETTTVIIENNPTSATTDNEELLLPSVKLPSKKEYADMEKLLTNFDDEFSNSLGITEQSTYMQTESANAMIADLAKILTGVSISGSIPTIITTTTNINNYNNNQDKYSEEIHRTTVIQSIMKHLFTKNDSNSEIELSLKVEQSTDNSLVLIITLSGVSSGLDTSLIELLVSPKEALIKIPKKYISNPTSNVQDSAIFGANYTGTLCSFNELHTSASFKKKKGILQIKINININ